MAAKRPVRYVLGTGTKNMTERKEEHVCDGEQTATTFLLKFPLLYGVI